MSKRLPKILEMFNQSADDKLRLEEQTIQLRLDNLALQRRITELEREVAGHRRAATIDLYERFDLMEKRLHKIENPGEAKDAK